MDISYKRTQRESYMIVQGEYAVEDYEERMLKENEIHSLLAFYTMQMDGKLQFWHDISGKQSFRDYLDQEQVSVEVVELLLRHLIIALEELQKYLIREGHILLLPETIYIGKQEQMQIYLCYCPGKKEEKPVLDELFTCIIDKVDHKKEKLMQLCYELYEMSLQEETTLYQLHSRVKEEVIEITEENLAVLPDNDIKYEMSVLSEEERAEDIYYRDKWTVLRDKVIQKGQKIKEFIEGWGKEKEAPEEWEDFLIEPLPQKKEPTELLYDGKKKCEGKLIYQGLGREKDYEIQGADFRIGHSEQDNDVCLKSNAVSRHHAKITREDGVFYIEDLNSTNGTYINGEPLSYTERRRLEAMDRIHFADVYYLFC